MTTTLATGAHHAIAHLNPQNVDRAHRALVAKAIAEFSHERLLAPEEVAPGSFRLAGPRSVYTFAARRFQLEHWVLDPLSIERAAGGAAQAIDAQAFIAEFAEQLGIPPALLPTYLEEIASTLASSCWKHARGDRPVEQLLTAGYQEIEAAMTEGHPAFVANNGRIGFGADDYVAYAPEAGSAVHLVWIAVRRSDAHLSLGTGVEEHELYAGELGEETLLRFAGVLADLALDAADYLYLPVHPWQWRNKVAVTFAPDIARRGIVYLGEGPDSYQAQQSIRTFFNLSQPERHYVKTALSIQNMGFMRGLSPRYMKATPAINDWVADLVASDDELRSCGFSVLRELAAIGYTGDAYHQLPDRSPFQKMIAALWRESPVPRIAPGERLATMASLIHRDADGNALVTAMINASGGDATEWVRRYLRAYVRPLIHCMLAYELVCMPHGENIVLVLQDHVPARVFLKDIGEETAVIGDLPLPPEVERIRADVPEDYKSLALHTDIFDGFLRYLSALLDADGVMAETAFWSLVAEAVAGHAADHPELAAVAERWGFFRDEFRHSCLNRLQLRNTLEMVNIADQASSLMFAGTLANPIARHR
ncbi:IucA/IucC family siderophore biosynthesis protein [Hoyosella sp. G463]|uniref:IucA/IucC family siderophore biosynthesis protein n=1 Tax=Lolliginicoccus lacisalsi TaxID=2742202 RepID=A0A927JAK4_9ACTN|nr:IucA/IucC family protein [Lolliginicoccus lacisalsi]MBD8504882.1 IucA/IucC family siderophore biosynthesis protein [Lolliginicoccus lacisalsi]